MGSLEPGSDCKPELDDSGCVQDDANSPKQTNGYVKPDLLDLSDDVLLYILRHCSPRDLKALGFSCPRLGSLSLDHTLWQRVDARGQATGPARAAWMLDHALSPSTTELLITGFAREVDGCLGVVNQSRKSVTDEISKRRRELPHDIITADLRNNTVTVRPADPRFSLSRDLDEPQVNRDPPPENEIAALDNIPDDAVVALDLPEGQEHAVFSVDFDPDGNADVPMDEDGDDDDEENDDQDDNILLAFNIRNGEEDQPPQNEERERGLEGNMDSDGSVEFDVEDDIVPTITIRIGLSAANPDPACDAGQADANDAGYACNNVDTGEVKPNTGMENGEGSKDTKAIDTEPFKSATHEKENGDNPVKEDKVADGESGEGDANDMKDDKDGEKMTAKSDEAQVDGNKSGAANEDKNVNGHVNDDQQPGPSSGSRAEQAPADQETPPLGMPPGRRRQRLMSQDSDSLSPPLWNGCQRDSPLSPDAEPGAENEFDKAVADENSAGAANMAKSNDNGCAADDQEPGPSREWRAPVDLPPPIGMPPGRRRRWLMAQQQHRLGRATSPWLSGPLPLVTTSDADHNPETARDDNCPGPLFTFTPKMMKQLRDLCPNLTSLAMDYCNINCRKTWLSHFPRTLTKLSLKGIKCYNLPMDKCFLFKIQDYLPVLEYLDVSDCEWLEPASILSLSKITELKHLILRDCCRLTEFTAYASLACRYGFKALEIVDLRGSPLGDSEVSAFSCVHPLRELYVSVASEKKWPPEHTHYKDDHMPPHQELDDWEVVNEDAEETVQPTDPEKEEDSDEDIEDSMEQSRDDFVPDVRCPGPGRAQRYVIISPRPRRAENRAPQPAGEGEQNGNEDETGEPGSSNGQSKKEAEKRKENGSGDANDAQPGPSKRRKDEPSSSKAGDSSDDDNDVPPKRSRDNTHRGFSPTLEPESFHALAARVEDGIRFAHGLRAPEWEREHFQRLRRGPYGPIRDPNDNEPLHKILYVNVSRRLHTVYRLSMPVGSVINADEFGHSDVVRRGRNISRMPPFFSVMHLDNSALITDVAIRAFGDSDSNTVNYIQIGRHGPAHFNRRPVRSNLRVLSITGFRNITDRTLTHLTTAAPHLRLLDLSRTSVTENGVETFRALRPECEVVYSPFLDKKPE